MLNILSRYINGVFDIPNLLSLLATVNGIANTIGVTGRQYSPEEEEEFDSLASMTDLYQLVQNAISETEVVSAKKRRRRRRDTTAIEKEDDTLSEQVRDRDEKVKLFPLFNRRSKLRASREHTYDNGGLRNESRSEQRYRSGSRNGVETKPKSHETANRENSNNDKNVYLTENLRKLDLLIQEAKRGNHSISVNFKKFLDRHKSLADRVVKEQQQQKNPNPEDTTQSNSYKEPKELEDLMAKFIEENQAMLQQVFNSRKGSSGGSGRQRPATRNSVRVKENRRNTVNVEDNPDVVTEIVHVGDNVQILKITSAADAKKDGRYPESISVVQHENPEDMEAAFHDSIVTLERLIHDSLAELNQSTILSVDDTTPKGTQDGYFPRHRLSEINLNPATVTFAASTSESPEVTITQTPTFVTSLPTTSRFYYQYGVTPRLPAGLGSILTPTGVTASQEVSSINRLNLEVALNADGELLTDYDYIDPNDPRLPPSTPATTTVDPNAPTEETIKLNSDGEPVNPDDLETIYEDKDDVDVEDVEVEVVNWEGQLNADGEAIKPDPELYPDDEPEVSSTTVATPASSIAIPTVSLNSDGEPLIYDYYDGSSSSTGDGAEVVEAIPSLFAEDQDTDSSSDDTMLTRLANSEFVKSIPIVGSVVSSLAPTESTPTVTSADGPTSVTIAEEGNPNPLSYVVSGLAMTGLLLGVEYAALSGTASLLSGRNRNGNSNRRANKFGRRGGEEGHRDRKRRRRRRKKKRKQQRKHRKPRPQKDPEQFYYQYYNSDEGGVGDESFQLTPDYDVDHVDIPNYTFNKYDPYANEYESTQSYQAPAEEPQYTDDLYEYVDTADGKPASDYPPQSQYDDFDDKHGDAAKDVEDPYYVDYDADLKPFTYDKLDYEDYQYDSHGNIDMTKPKKSEQRKFRKRKQNIQQQRHHHQRQQQRTTTPKPGLLR